MKHFLRTTDANNQTELVVALMQRQDRFKENGHAGVSVISVPQADMPVLTDLTLQALSIAKSLDLNYAMVVRGAPGTTMPLGNRGVVALLQVQAGHPVILSAEDEAVYGKTCEVWYFNAPANLVNKTEDDVLAFLVAIHDDRSSGPPVA